MAEELELDLFEERRVFLGWDRPLLPLVVEWLLERREELSGMAVVVPTAQSGRRLREALAEAGAGLAPRVVRPEWFLPTNESTAGRNSELVAWMEVMESVEDWTEFAGAFPFSPGLDEEAGWSMGLAKSLADLRLELLDAGLTLREAARRMRGAEDAARWNVLGSLEERVNDCLRRWRMTPRSQVVLAGKPELPESVKRVILAGVADLTPLVEGVLGRLDQPLSVLVGAPDRAKDGFDSWGRARAAWWTGRCIDLDGEAIHICADAGHEATVARECVAMSGTRSSEQAIGTADAGVTPELMREFAKDGWMLYDPAGSMLSEGGMMDWLSRWREFVGSGEVRHLASLVGAAPAGRLMKTSRFQLSRALAVVRREAMPQRVDDLRRLAGAEWFIKEQPRAAKAAGEVWAAIQPLLEWRERFRTENFAGYFREFLAVIGPRPGEDEEMDELRVAGDEFLAEIESWREVMARRGAAFGLSLFREVAGRRRRFADQDNTVLDVQGWIELAFDPARQVVVCGMNEGCVPERLGGEPWLNNNVREYLKLENEAGREARDAWLLTNLVESRKRTGRVDLICGRRSATGEPMLPSRLLVRCERERLAERVIEVYRTPESPGAGIPWTRDWALNLPAWEEKEKLSVTSFGSYLACPFRFYLSNVLRMEHPEVERVEWNAREFGTVAHEVLERFGRDDVARDLVKAEAVAAWLGRELDEVVSERHGARPPLAVRMQAESLRQRLGYFARVQAHERAEGWKIVEVEKPFEMELGGLLVRGMIDRIERHDDYGWRVSDYKTGGEEVRKAHLTQLRSNTRLPAHIAEEKAVRVTMPGVFRGKIGKPAEFVWKNLQVPLYALAWQGECGELPEVGYFTIWKSAAEVRYDGWLGFDENVVQSATSCAEWVVGKVRAGEFWPPAEKAKYDHEFEELAMRRPLIEAFVAPTGKGGDDE